jgi:hypothetical protein
MLRPDPIDSLLCTEDLFNGKAGKYSSFAIFVWEPQPQNAFFLFRCIIGCFRKLLGMLLRGLGRHPSRRVHIVGFKGSLESLSNYVSSLLNCLIAALSFHLSVDLVPGASGKVLWSSNSQPLTFFAYALEPLSSSLERHSGQPECLSR